MSEAPESWDDVNQTSHLTWPDQIARIRADYDARIEALEAALREIADLPDVDADHRSVIARNALEGQANA